jgi:hypothetical protein
MRCGWREEEELRMRTVLRFQNPMEHNGLRLGGGMAIRESCNQVRSAGQQQRLRLRSLVTHILQHAPDLAITFTWSPGHLDIDGNERADELAKRGAELGIEREKATRGRIEHRNSMKSRRTGRARFFRVGMEDWEESDDEEWGAGGVLERSETLAGRMQLMASAALSGPEEQVVSQEGEVEGGEDLPKSLSALKQAWREEEKREWERMWRRSAVGAGLRSIDPRQPGPSFTKQLHSLSRRNATLLSRLRLDFNDLGATKRFLNASSPERLCECGREEMREHFLLECERYAGARRELRREMGRMELMVRSVFLPQFVFPLLRFIHSSERFPRFFCLFDTPSPSSPSDAQFLGSHTRHRSSRRSATELIWN